MSSSYQKVLKKIIDVEKSVKLNKQDINILMEQELKEKNFLRSSSDDVLEDYRNLKDNISVRTIKSYNLAYQPVRVRSRKWSEQDL